MVNRKMAMLLFMILYIALSFHVFMISFIENGEERLWLMNYMIMAPFLFAVAGWFILPSITFNFKFLVSSIIGLITFLLLYVLPQIADTFNRNKNKVIYPCAVGVEGLYLRSFNYDRYYHVEHSRKLFYISYIRILNSCNLNQIKDLFKEMGDAYNNDAYVLNYLKKFSANSKCPKDVRDYLKHELRHFMGD